MNIKSNTFIKILLILITVVIILYYDKIFPSYNILNNTSQNKIESFLTVTDFLNTESTEKPKLVTVYEKSIINHELLKNNPELVCNILPILDCPNRIKFPVHIIKLITGSYLAVFNDGMLYTTDNYKENIWNGPLTNSMPNRFTPLRMVNTTPYGNIIVGVGYDGKCYIKNSERLLDLTVEWELIEDIKQEAIYLMYYFDTTTGKVRKVIINTAGKLMIQQDNGSFNEIGGLYPSLLKVYYDYNGYLLGIDNNFNLGSFDNKNWYSGIATYGKKSMINKHNYVNDVIYDNDNKLVAITFNEIDKILEFKKQIAIGYEHKFITLNKGEQVESRITDYQIIISKIGMGELLGMYNEQESPLDNDIELAYQRQVISDNAELREFCAQRQDILDTDFIDVELNNQLSVNQEKIDKINNLLSSLL
jgi:UDP-N-acetylglucosamine transferase subunit ALG13